MKMDMNSSRMTRIVILAAESTIRPGDTVTLATSYWKTAYSCKFESAIDQLKEGPWTWNKAMRLSSENCPIENGASGSPLLNQEGRIVGIINTVNMEGELCTLSNPCEVAPEGPVVKMRANYGLFVVGLNQCLNKARRLDFSLPSCSFGK